MISGDQMIINSVIKNEAIRNREMIAQYEKLLEALPKGSLILRKKEYYYLKYREDGKLHDDYIGKDPEKIAKIKDKLEQRNHYEKMLASLKKERKVIAKIKDKLEQRNHYEKMLASLKKERKVIAKILEGLK